MNSSRASFLPLAAAIFTLSAPGARAIVLFDGITDVTAFTLATAPNTFTGEAMALDAGGFAASLNSVSSFEIGVGNVTGTAITNRPVRLNMWIYLTYSPSSTAAPAFADQVGLAGSPTLVFDFADFTLNSGFLAVATLNLAVPLTLTPTSGTTIGLGLNWQVDQGAGFVSLNNFSTVIHGGGTQPPPSIGANVTGASPNFGYYRNASSETNGNFAGTSLRQIGANSGLLIRINGPDPVPEPGTTVLGIVFGLTLLSRRSRRA